ncbi:hypothetical protein HanXRQr2_Chr06g0241271 [Helianthus annuus]|uniref:Uncharacterized protein n=1 Tax=Helianthus annuus TaxID=4232 RepID=A0A9K3IPZ3_HELAN|nr:hypothetical protein HanXRQr2_Chr06g0241271 [Helianthus annuus]
MPIFGSGHLEMTIEPQMLMKREDDHSRLLTLGPVTDIFMHTRYSRNGGCGPDRDLTQLLKRLERNHDLVRTSLRIFLPKRGPIFPSLVNHEHSRRPLAELHEVHSVNRKRLLLSDSAPLIDATSVFKPLDTK